MKVTDRGDVVLRLLSETQKSVSLYLVFFRSLLIIAVAAFWEDKGVWFVPSPVRWCVSSVAITGAGCLRLMAYAPSQLLRKMRARRIRACGNRGVK